MLVWLLGWQNRHEFDKFRILVFWWASPGRDPDLRNRLRRRREKGWTTFGRAEIQEQQEQDVEVDFGSKLLTIPNEPLKAGLIKCQFLEISPWWIERELLSFCEIGLNYSEQAELIEQFLVGSWFLWLFGIGPFFGDDWGNLLFSGPITNLYQKVSLQACLPLNLGSPFEDLILSWNRFLNRKV